MPGKNRANLRYSKIAKFPKTQICVITMNVNFVGSSMASPDPCCKRIGISTRLISTSNSIFSAPSGRILKI